MLDFTLLSPFHLLPWLEEGWRGGLRGEKEEPHVTTLKLVTLYYSSFFSRYTSLPELNTYCLTSKLSCTLGMTVLLSHSAFFSAPLPCPLPLPTEPTINVSALTISLVTWLLPSSLPHSYLSLFSSFPIQPREHLSLPKHSILSKGDILLP